MLSTKLLLLSACLLANLAASRHNILDYGAVSGKDSLKAERANQDAFIKALKAANETESLNDREVYVPANMTFHSLPIRVDQLYNVTLTIDGTIKASKRMN